MEEQKSKSVNTEKTEKKKKSPTTGENKPKQEEETNKQTEKNKPKQKPKKKYPSLGYPSYEPLVTVERMLHLDFLEENLLDNTLIPAEKIDNIRDSKAKKELKGVKVSDIFSP